MSNNSTSFTRVYPFKSVLNFRDFGHYDTTTGHTVKPGLLFRAAHFNRSQDNDLAAIEALKLGLLVDLRQKPERARQPNRLPDGHEIEIFEYSDQKGDNRDKAPHEMFMEMELYRPEDARAYMQRSYSTRPNDAGFRHIFGSTLKHMAKNGEPIVIHCAAGKDRTGTLAAIILASLGVDNDTIMEDYMLTMKAVNIDPFLEPAAKQMSERFGRSIDPEALRPMFGVEPSYLEAALSTIGDMRSYVTNALGVSQEEQDALLKLYVN